ncbi:thermostable hemolysin [Alteromonas sp. A081]|uniref:thermostable hemolysin n=1 Tax=Alteromonas sp. A081 TaxID=3410269 RepID=UPI003B97E3B1
MLSTELSSESRFSARCVKHIYPRNTLAQLFIGVEESLQRGELQRLITHGFARSYHATLQHFMPVLLGVGGSKPFAALGARSAASPLFVESYTPVPIEDMLAQVNLNVARNQVAEIGNLYSRNGSFTQPLLLLTALSLQQLHYSVIVFAATSSLRDLMTAISLPLTYLCDASKHCVPDNGKEWGTYYETKPQVVALRTREVSRLVAGSEPVANMFDCMAPLLPEITNVFEAHL